VFVYSDDIINDTITARWVHGVVRIAMRMMFQTRPSADELTELRGSVLQQIDTNRDGKIELGEFARYIITVTTLVVR